MRLRDLHTKNDATLAADGIPLHYGDLAAEYEAALNGAALFDRSHEGRVQLLGDARYDLLNRMSTNKMTEMAANEGRATIFTQANARILDRIEAFNRDDHLLLLTEPGRGAWLIDFLQKNIFFGDDARLVDLSAVTGMLALHGVTADAIMADLGVVVEDVTIMSGTSLTIGDVSVYAVKRKPVSGAHWQLIVPSAQIVSVYEALLAAGKSHGLRPAGSLTFNTLRIRAGRPARPELNDQYLPLEVGLWDEVHFAKGCYTGQEIIARMESRERLARTIVTLNLDEMVQAPAKLTVDGKTAGTMTSSVQAPDGTLFALAVIKTIYITPGTELRVGDAEVRATVSDLVGVQPDFLEQD